MNGLRRRAFQLCNNVSVYDAAYLALAEALECPPLNCGIGVDVVCGRGRLAGERTVRVATEDGPSVTLTARKAVVIATGSRAAARSRPGGLVTQPRQR